MGKDEQVRSTYRHLLEALHTLGPFQEEPKNTSIHLVRPPGREFATTESVLYDEHRDAVR